MKDDSDDPFRSLRTVIKPRAGRAARAVPQDDEQQARAPTASFPDLASGIAGADPDNPLLSAATPLLSAYSRIRTMTQHVRPRELQATLADGIRRFETAARRAGVPEKEVVGASYVLCTILDEAASSTPWGGSGVWASQSLLVAFHQEAWGGEMFFQLLARLLQDVPANRHLVELMCIALHLGFKGRYQVQTNGDAQLEAVRERVTRALQEAGGPVDKELSPHWTGERRGDARLRDGVPVWAVAAFAGVALGLVFMGLRISVNTHSDPTFQSLQSIDLKKAPAPAVALKPPPATPRLSSFLKPEVDAGVVEVRDYPDHSVVTIRGDGLFEPGSAEIDASVRPLLGRIAQALNAVPGAVLVTGHTDNQPIRSVRYPSNWHLSRDRAESVRAVLARTVKPDRLRAEGRADSEPISDNTTPAGRARNRRVEIILYAVPAA